MSYGESLFNNGIFMIGAGLLLFLVGLLVFALIKSRLKKKLMDKYGM